MSNTIDPTILKLHFLTWFYAHVWTVSTFTQGVIILTAVVVAGAIHQLSSPRIGHGISRLHVFPRLKLLLHTLRRLVFPFALFVTLLVVRISADLGELSLDTNLIDAVMNMLAAWIVIGLALQFIGNHFIRNLFTISIWIIAALHIMGILGATAKMLDGIGLDIGTVHLSILSVIKGIFALGVLMYGAIFISSLLERRIRLNKSLSATSKVLITKSVRIGLIVFALLIAVAVAGIDLSLLAVFSGGIGLGLGFGLQRVVSNLFSGMLLLLDRSIKPGDIIEMPNGAFGWVEKMGARYTEIVTRDNKSYLIPNENFITQQVINWSHGDTLVRLEVAFGVDYASDPHQVIKLACAAALMPERVVADPPPECSLAEFGDNALNFKLLFWIADAETGAINVRGDIMLALWDTFKAHDIQIPYPHRIVHLRQGEPKTV